MTSDQIEKFLTSSQAQVNPLIKIAFKTRSSLEGIFVKTPDYAELKSKNFWRIVTGPKVDHYKTSKDTSLAKIFNGAEITKLSSV